MRFQVAQALAHFLWQGLAIAAILFILLHFLRSANARYNACAGALALMCASPVATFFYLAPHASALAGTRGMVLDTALASSRNAPASWFEANATRLFWLWLSGALFLLVRAALSWWRARRVVTRGFEPLVERLEAPARRLAVQLGAKSVRFRVSARVASALMFGWLKPIIVLPAAALGRLTEAEIEALLAHELAHVVRRDFLANLLQTIAECVLFYHPLVWWVSARMREERELCCDDFAVAVCRDEVLYSKALLRLEELRMEPALAATGGRLSLRIRRLLDGPETSRIAVAPALAFVLVFGVSVALLAQNAPPAPPEPPEPAAAVEAVALLPQPASPDGSQTAYRIGSDVSAPRLLYKVEPDYTAEAHAAHLEGRVVLSVVVSAEGLATDIKVVESLDKGLDGKAIEAVRKWKFEPGLKNGQPVPVMATIEIHFRLLEKPPAPPVASVPAVAPAPPEPPEAGETLPIPPSTGVVGGVPEAMMAADAERAALEQERLRTAAERQAAAAERAQARKARQEAEAALQSDVAKASAMVASNSGSQKSMDELNRKVAALTRLEEEKARAEVDKAREEMKIAARESQLAQAELLRAERDANRAQADADRLRQKLEAEHESRRQDGTKEAELKRRQAYAASHFGGENTDRGKAYVHYGPPDEIDSHPTKGLEIWRYKDASKSKVTLELEFQGGKQVRSSDGAATPGARKP
jgi:TonB family protein